MASFSAKTTSKDHDAELENRIPLQTLRSRSKQAAADQPESQHDVQNPVNSNQTSSRPQPSSGTALGKSPPKSALVRYWKQHISLDLDHNACRDHLAVERTFLGYFRTSLLLSNIGVTITQLFALSEPDTGFGYSRVALPLSMTFLTGAIATVILGAVRGWRLQRGLVQGKALCGGFELRLLAGGLFILIISVFILLTILADGSKEKP